MAAGTDLTSRLGAALDVLLAPRAGNIVDLRARTDDHVVVGSVGVAKERDVVDKLRGGRGPAILIVDRIGATLRRALRDHPIALVIATGEALSEDDLGETPCLGPDARVIVGQGRTIVVAHDAGDLAGLVRAFGPARVRLAIAPTPPWLPTWLASAALREHRIAGTVAATSLSPAWAIWARTANLADVVVPLGVPEPALDRPRADELDVVIAAHELERHTGPVFPSPRVIALVHDQLAGTATSRDADGTSLAVWSQARRALPWIGALVGMEQPVPGLPNDAPTAAFLAQRVLLRAQARRTAIAAAGSPPAGPAADALARAREVLHNAGETLTDQETKVVLKGVGMNVTRQAVASSASGASGFAERIGFPVVLKALSPELRRRQEIGAIELDLANSAAVRRAYSTIVDAVERRAPTARLDGVVVAEHVAGGLDVHAGIVRSRSGALAVFARPLAGDHALEPVLAPGPLSWADAVGLADAALARIPVPALRRESDPPATALADVLWRLGLLVEHFGDRITQIDVDPVRLLADARGYVVLDARGRQRAHLEGR